MNNLELLLLPSLNEINNYRVPRMDRIMPMSRYMGGDKRTLGPLPCTIFMLLCHSSHNLQLLSKAAFSAESCRSLSRQVK